MAKLIQMMEPFGMYKTGGIYEVSDSEAENLFNANIAAPVVEENNKLLVITIEEAYSGIVKKMNKADIEKVAKVYDLEYESIPKTSAKICAAIEAKGIDLSKLDDLSLVELAEKMNLEKPKDADRDALLKLIESAGK